MFTHFEWYPSVYACCIFLLLLFTHAYILYTVACIHGESIWELEFHRTKYLNDHFSFLKKFCNGILDFLDLLGLKVQKIQNAVTKKFQ